jgi:hypothetical protein
LEIAAKFTKMAVCRAQHDFVSESINSAMSDRKSNYPEADVYRLVEDGVAAIGEDPESLHPAYLLVLSLGEDSELSANEKVKYTDAGIKGLERAGASDLAQAAREFVTRSRNFKPAEGMPFDPPNLENFKRPGEPDDMGGF